MTRASSHTSGVRRLALFAKAVACGAWGFVIGDDWRIALGVALALVITSVLASAGVPAWWVVPLAVIGLLALSVRRAARR